VSRLFSALSAKIFVGVSLALLAFNIWTQLQLSGARSALKFQTDRAAALLKDKQLCEASIVSWQTIAAERQKRADDALATARQKSVIHTQTASTILKEVPVSDDQCVAAADLLKRYQ
jgi:hypothetical protein